MLFLRGVIKYLLVAIVAIIALVIVVIFLLYMPAIQNRVKDIALDYVNEVSEYKISVERLDIKFPLNIYLKGVSVIEENKDTVFSVEELNVDVVMSSLIHGQIGVRYLNLNGMIIAYPDSLSGMEISTDVNVLKLKGAILYLRRSHIDLTSLKLEGGTIYIQTGKSPPDTGSSESIPWSVQVGEISLKDVEYEMKGEGMGALRVGGDELFVRSANLSMEKQEVSVTQIQMDGVYCELYTDTTSNSTVSTPSAVESEPWRVEVADIELDGCRFLMRPKDSDSTSLSFPEQIMIYNLSSHIDGVYFSDGDLHAEVYRLSFKEGSGVDITKLSAKIDVSAERMLLDKFELNTPYSRITAGAQVNSGLAGFDLNTPIVTKIVAELGSYDILLFLPDSLVLLRESLEEKRLNVELEADGAIDSLIIRKLFVDIPRYVSLEGKGEISDVMQPDSMNGNIELGITISDGTLFNSLFDSSDSIAESFVTPPLTIKTMATLLQGEAEAKLIIDPPIGQLSLDAFYGLKDTTYRIDLSVDMPLQQFIPKDTNGIISSTLFASGKGLNPQTMVAELDFKVDSLLFNGIDYSGVSLAVDVNNGELNGDICGNSESLDMALKLNATIADSSYSASLAGEIKRADLYALGLFNNPLISSFGLDINGKMDGDKIELNSNISNIILDIEEEVLRLGTIDISAFSDATMTQAEITNGDLQMMFSSSGSRDLIIGKFTDAIDALNEQIENYAVDMNDIDKRLPEFNLHLDAAQNNMLYDLLSLYGISFDDFKLRMAGSSKESFRINSIVNGAAYDSIKMDSLVFDLRQDGEPLFFHAALMGSSKLLSDLTYDGSDVGTIKLNADYYMDMESRHFVKMDITLDDEEILIVDGTIEEDERINLSVDIPQLPLQMINPFIPQDMLRVDGVLKGEISIGGGFTEPLVNGKFLFEGGGMEIIPIGTHFSIDESVVQIKNTLLEFNRFGIISANKERVNLDGYVDFKDFDNIKSNIAITARNFQAINSKYNIDSKSLVTGKAYLDTDLTVDGTIDALRIRGNMSLLDNTDITYIMQNSPLSDKDHGEDMVKFISFNDTVTIDPHRTIGKINSSTINLLVGLNIRSLARVAINLSQSGNNSVRFNGGGDLIFTMNDMGDMRLTGKYELDKGEVSYNVPLIGVKYFTIGDGNYVRWGGELLNPDLNIEAVERVTTNVESGGVSRMVAFSVIIRISGSLEKMDITFDVVADGDSEIKNQLATMPEEERSRAAMTLLVTGGFEAGDVKVKSNSSGYDALYDLVERELNNWSRENIKGVDLSFGIDSYENASGMGQRTDYSYQLSKRLFSNRMRVKIGGRITSDSDPDNQHIEQNLIDDISMEYLFLKNSDYFLKLFRHTGYESVLEGEITKTGVGVVLRRKYDRFRDIFKSRRRINRMRELRGVQYRVPSSAEESVTDINRGSDEQ